jgi:hypothetical protein
MLAEATTATSNRATVLAALSHAARATGTDFDYLLGTAMRESSLKPAAKSATSSATGLFQFVDQTWLGMIKNYGAKYGLGGYADAISQGADGRYRVADRADRSAILALRTNPDVSALMEGEYAQASRATLKDSLGREVCGGELYAAHFLGNDAACRLIRLSGSDPSANAAHAFPAAAGANWSVFHHADGTAKTVREVYDWAMKQTHTGTVAEAASVAPETSTAAMVTGPLPELTDDAGLLASLASWRPRHGFFSTAAKDDGAAPPAPIQLSPGVMDVLSGLDPVAPGSAAN